jgi:nucleoside-diphosphate-sugar epimerase
VTRIAVLGANGQVGVELCLLLARQPGIELVPVCRNHLGSAYLRSIGIPVRHGDPTDPDAAGRLYGDCDVVANLALVPTARNPSSARKSTAALVGNVAASLGPRGRHVYFSTMSVYGDAEVGDVFAIANAYGRDKRQAEAAALRAGRLHRCPTVVLRLGHVAGELQGITREIRNHLSRGVVHLPDAERPSNLTYLPTIADAVLRAAAGTPLVGTYDLFNEPQWSWREVLDFEAGRLGLSWRSEPIADRGGLSLNAGARRLVSRAVGLAVASDVLRKLGSRTLTLLPDATYRRLKARYATVMAGRDGAALTTPCPTMSAVFRKPLVPNRAPGLRPTRELLADPTFALPAGACGPAWPSDLPPAG